MRQWRQGFVMSVLFPCPAPSYNIDSFPGELIWVPKRPPTETGPLEEWDGDHIPCLFLLCESARFLIIFFHSNAEDLGRCRWFCLFLRDQFQVHVLAVEYPGYGVCPGIATSVAAMENAQAALLFAMQVLKLPLSRVKLFGRSIGTGLALDLASKYRVAGLILVTPFRSVRLLFQDKIGPLGMLVDEWFPNDEAILQVTSPTIIIHGQKDVLIPCGHGEALYNSCTARKLFVNPPEMEHNTNLTSDISFLIVPMFRFFTLPDYMFVDLKVPTWVFDKRRSPLYVRPSVEVCSHRVPSQAPQGIGTIEMPGGDDETDMPIQDADRDKPYSVSLETLFQSREMGEVRPRERPKPQVTKDPWARTADPMTQPTVRHSTSATKSRYPFADSETVNGKLMESECTSEMSTPTNNQTAQKESVLIEAAPSHDENSQKVGHDAQKLLQSPLSSARLKTPRRSLTPVRGMFSQPLNLLRNQSPKLRRSLTPTRLSGFSPFRSRGSGEHARRDQTENIAVEGVANADGGLQSSHSKRPSLLWKGSQSLSAGHWRPHGDRGSTYIDDGSAAHSELNSAENRNVSGSTFQASPSPHRCQTASGPDSNHGGSFKSHSFQSSFRMGDHKNQT